MNPTPGVNPELICRRTRSVVSASPQPSVAVRPGHRPSPEADRLTHSRG